MPKQQLGLGGAIAIGLASMLGAGVFVVFAIAYTQSAQQIFWAIGLAALVASLNSAAIYQLAARVDRPGGVYAYARVYRSNWLSFAAGFAFVFGKIASIAAIAITVQKYITPGQSVWPSVLMIALLTGINILGISRTANVATVISVITIVFFLAFIFLASNSPKNHFAEALTLIPSNPDTAALAGAGIIFFAFAGYARVATLGNEVKNARVNIPKAILIVMVSVTLIYLVLAVVLLDQLGLGLAGANTPIADVFQSLTGNQLVTPFVAGIAGLGSMLALLAGVSRTAATMAEDGELPRLFQLRNGNGAPWVAEIVVGAGAATLTFANELTLAIALSSISVLLYYGIGHLSAFSQPAAERLYGKTVNVFGFALCSLLILTFPLSSVEWAFGILATALIVRALNQRFRSN